MQLTRGEIIASDNLKEMKVLVCWNYHEHQDPMNSHIPSVSNHDGGV